MANTITGHPFNGQFRASALHNRRFFPIVLFSRLTTLQAGSHLPGMSLDFALQQYQFRDQSSLANTSCSVHLRLVVRIKAVGCISISLVWGCAHKFFANSPRIICSDISSYAGIMKELRRLGLISPSLHCTSSFAYTLHLRRHLLPTFSKNIQCLTWQQSIKLEVLREDICI
jgi:hypothetical protein